MGIGDWGLGIGDWGVGPIPKTQYPKPQAQKEINLSGSDFLININ